MQLSDKALDELRAIYREEFQQDITREEASEIGMRLIGLIRLLLRPLPNENEQPDLPPVL